MNSIQTPIERMGSNFLVASMIPSLAFITITIFSFRPVLPPVVYDWLSGNGSILGQYGLTVLVATIILGFTLTSLNTFILKVFEGYILVGRFPIVRYAELRRFKQYKKRLRLVNMKIQRISKMRGNQSERILRKLIEQERQLVTNFQYLYPPLEEEVLPFRFGNILRAAEAYPMARYKIDAVPMWTRLIHLVPPSYNARIVQTHNQLSFLVNCSVLSILYSIFCLFAALYQIFLQSPSAKDLKYWFDFLPTELEPGAYTSQFTLYLTGCIVGAFIAIIFNRASLLSVSDFGEMIRSAYDLFRFDLLKQLHLPLPDNSELELNLWIRITNLINIGYSLEGKTPLKPIQYQHNYEYDVESSSEDGEGNDKEQTTQTDL